MAGYHSISHRTHSLKEREAILPTLLSDEQHPRVILQTCNRIEVYEGNGAIDEATVRHLFRVASGLESSLTGEGAILGQIRRAYYDAKDKFALSPVIHKLFQTAIHTGKRVRTETGIAKGAVSHSQATARMIASTNAGLHDSFITIVGVNQLTGDLIRFLNKEGARTIILANRNLANAEAISRKYGCGAVSLAERKRFIPLSDVLICATSAPHYLIGPDDIAESKKLQLFDLSFPRNIDPAVREKQGVTLHDLENIESYVRGMIGLREDFIPAAERIIDQEILKYKKWYEGYTKYGRGKI